MTSLKLVEEEKKEETKERVSITSLTGGTEQTEGSTSSKKTSFIS